MSLSERFEVKTNYTLNNFQKGVCIFLFALGLVGIAAGGLLFMLLSLGIWFGSQYISKKHPVAIILTYDGIEHVTAFNNKTLYFIPWKDIDGFCLIEQKQHGFIVVNRFLGIRLKRYENYLNNLESTVDPKISSGKLYKFISSQSENMMLLIRKKYGCEFMVAQNLLDRSIPEFISFLEEYHQAFGSDNVSSKP
jgi:hypothetical protein